jgi:hypothetical protein
VLSEYFDRGDAVWVAFWLAVHQTIGGAVVLSISEMGGNSTCMLGLGWGPCSVERSCAGEVRGGVEIGIEVMGVV